MDTYKLKIELFRMIDELPPDMLEELYQSLKVKSNMVEEPLSEWQRKDIEKGLNDLEEGKKMDFDEFITSL